MKIVLGILAVVLAVMFVSPPSRAVDVPKTDSFTLMAETIKAKRPRQSTKAKVQKCIAECHQDCWFNCDEGCRCICGAIPKGEFCIPPG
jgi:hypothetical protein